MLNVIFDFSGTLANDTQQVFLANMKLLELFNITHYPSNNNIPNELRGEEITRENIFSLKVGSYLPALRLRGVSADECCDSCVKNLYAGFLEEVASDNPAKVYPGVNKLLLKLYENENIGAMGVVSSHPENTLRMELGRNGMNEYFPIVYGGVENKSAKLIELKEKIGEENPFLYIGDSKSDMIFGRKAGYKIIGVTWGYQPRKFILEGKPNFTARNTDKLEKIILNQTQLIL